MRSDELRRLILVFNLAMWRKTIWQMKEAGLDYALAITISVTGTFPSTTSRLLCRRVERQPCVAGGIACLSLTACLISRITYDPRTAPLTNFLRGYVANDYWSLRPIHQCMDLQPTTSSCSCTIWCCGISQRRAWTSILRMQEWVCATACGHAHVAFSTRILRRR